MTTHTTVWYREPFVWLLVSFPLWAVVSGIVMLTLALKSDDGLVVDDYYRRGKEINLELKRDRAAVARGVVAHLTLDGATHGVRIDLNLTAVQAPTQIELRLLHATRQGNDREFLLVRAVDGSYRAALLGLTPGNYHVQIAAEDWRLLGTLRVPHDTRIEIRPAQPAT